MVSFYQLTKHFVRCYFLTNTLVKCAREANKVKPKTVLAIAAAAALLSPLSALGAVTGVLDGQTMNGQAIPCVAGTDGIRLCTGDESGVGGTDLRFKSFDGTPLTVFVSLPAVPASGPDGGYPLVVQNHGWGAPPSGPNDAQYGTPTAVALAKDGYAVLQFQARGWGNSCGTAASRSVNPAACAKGYVHLDDYRFEARDVQYVVGLLVDSGLVDPNAVGVGGESYGAGVSLQLATLNNRVMDLDGSLIPWTSPKGTPLHIAAAVPYAGWSDLVYSLVPNGRTFDSGITSATADTSIIGVVKESILSGLYAEGYAGQAYFAPAGTDPEADSMNWYNYDMAGEPYNTPMIQDAAMQVAKFRSPFYLLAGAYGFAQVQPSPILWNQGFTDDVFPADEVLRYYNLERTLYPSAPFSMFFFDGGHQRGNNKLGPDLGVFLQFVGRTKAFFDYYLKGKGSRPANDVVAYAQTCPTDVPSLGPYAADTWEALHPGEIAYSSASAQTVLSAGGDPSVSKAFDPVAGGLACTTATGAAEGPGVANYELPTPTGAGYTLLGAPTVTADFTVTGQFAYIAARLVDVDPGTNTKVLVARGLYRFDPDSPNGRQTFQLHANGWRFAPGHFARLELLGRDTPYARVSNGTFSVDVSNLELRLPTHEAQITSITESGSVTSTSGSGGTFGWLTLLPLIGLSMFRRRA